MESEMQKQKKGGTMISLLTAIILAYILINWFH